MYKIQELSEEIRSSVLRFWMLNGFFAGFVVAIGSLNSLKCWMAIDIRVTRALEQALDICGTMLLDAQMQVFRRDNDK